MIDASLVAQRFAQASQSYNAHAIIQKQIAQQLMTYMQRYALESGLAKQVTPRAFEIGCGSGNLSRLFMQDVAFDRLYLNDLYEEVQQHFASTARIEWRIGDIQQLDLPPALDLVISSSALQWVTDLDAVLSKAYQALQPKGYLCFSSFGADNLKEIKALTGCGLNYLSLHALRHKLLAAGFEVVLLQDQIQYLYFDHPKQVLQHLKATGVTATASQFRWTRQSLQQFYQQYSRFSVLGAQDKVQYCLSYHPIYCIARRP